MSQEDKQFIKNIIIVDDDFVNRQIVRKILETEYSVVEAENGNQALEILNDSRDEISAIILDLVMPEMDGYEFLEKIREVPEYANIPVIVTTGNDNNENEIKALELGAWDFVSKPYNSKVLLFRLKNALQRSQLSAFESLKYLAEYDTLTGIYNKSKLFAKAKEYIMENPKEDYMFLRLDIVHFQLINSYFGMNEGDKLLKYIADNLRKITDTYGCVCGRLDSDIFGLCCVKKVGCLESILKSIRESLEIYNPDYNILPCIGIYYIKNNNMSMDKIYDRATLAAKTCKGNYINYYAVYNEHMSDDIQYEQEIINNMAQALEEEQFCVYLQPKYDLSTKQPAGAEALVRWNHPEIGMISPGIFIPIFERNGFISRLDYYVWEKVCQWMRKWIDKGRELLPISVNVSRVDLYNPKFVENICELVDKYNIPKDKFNLELTESAYTDNPNYMIETMEKLQEKGFRIMMDDFGSGYSSLNILKDMKVDYLKIDMRFMERTKQQGRGENILASVVRMSKWLDMPVIAEGVETKDQARFLHSIGCEYVQGYYFARPMPIQDYEELLMKQEEYGEYNLQTLDFDINALWEIGSQTDLLFSGILQPIAMYEYKEEHIEIIRVNQAFCELFNKESVELIGNNVMDIVQEEYKESFKKKLKEIVTNKGIGEYEYVSTDPCVMNKKIKLKLKYISPVGTGHILFGTLYDITGNELKYQ